MQNHPIQPVGHSPPVTPHSAFPGTPYQPTTAPYQGTSVLHQLQQMVNRPLPPQYRPTTSPVTPPGSPADDDAGMSAAAVPPAQSGMYQGMLPQQFPGYPQMFSAQQFPANSPMFSTQQFPTGSLKPSPQDFPGYFMPAQPSTKQELPATGAVVDDVPTRDANGRKLPRWQVKRHFCTLCDKRFESNHKLLLHTRSHTGEKPHKCEVCNMAFSRAFCYRRHLKTHTNVKPWKCSRCGRGFRERYDMETHEMTEVCLKGKNKSTKKVKQEGIEANDVPIPVGSAGESAIIIRIPSSFAATM